MHLASSVRIEFDADWAAVLRGDELLAAIGRDIPHSSVLYALATGTTASPAVASGEAGPDDLAVAPLPGHASVLLVGAAATRSAGASAVSSSRSPASRTALVAPRVGEMTAEPNVHCVVAAGVIEGGAWNRPLVFLWLLRCLLHGAVCDALDTRLVDRVELDVETPVVVDARRVDVAADHGGLHRASRFAVVRAIPEAALRRERLDVGKGQAHAFVGIPQRDRTQAGRVDEHPAARKHDELARGRGVPAALIGGAHRARGLHVVADETVDERGLAHARRADERDGAVAGPVRAQSVDAGAGDRARDHDLDAGRRALDRLDGRRASSGGSSSALVSTTTGVAPLSNASTSSRSRRRRFGPLVSDCTMNTVSTFAATTCASTAAPSIGSPRTNVERRGNTSVTSCPASLTSMNTQSPVAGKVEGIAGPQPGRGGRDRTGRSQYGHQAALDVPDAPDGRGGAFGGIDERGQLIVPSKDGEGVVFGGGRVRHLAIRLGRE